MDEDVPYYGDKKLAARIVYLYYEENMSYPQIIQTLNLDVEATSIFKIINNLIIAVYKKQMGIKKKNEYTYEEIKAYYEKNKDTMKFIRKVYYQRYFERVEKAKGKVTTRYYIPPVIISDLMKENNNNYLELAQLSQEEVLALLRKYKKTLSTKTINTLLLTYNIKKRELMSGKDQIKVLRFLSKVTISNKKMIKTSIQ